jgi:hypothetical protein
MLKFNDTTEEKININDKEYILDPCGEKKVLYLYETIHKYSELDKNATQQFTSSEYCIKTELSENHRKNFPNFLDEDLCQCLIDEFEKNPNGIQDPQVLESIIPKILTDSLDREIISYLNSEYCIFWWSINKVDKKLEETGYFTKWHCDAGPQKHLKILIYLNGHDEHESDTGFLNKETTDKLKKIGYIYNNIEHRSLDISELCKHYKIDFNPQLCKPNTGDCLVFNPSKIAHKAYAPKIGKSRYALNLCLVQSETNWREVWGNYFLPAYSSQSFDGFAQKALTFKPINISNNTPNNKPIQKSHIEIPLDNEINNLEHLQYLAQSVFSDGNIANFIYQHFINTDPQLVNCRSIFHFVNISKKLLHERISITEGLDKATLQGLMDLADYEKYYIDSTSRYNMDVKPKPFAVFWPNPKHPKHPQSKYNALPFVNKHPIMNKNTPIGSAGSCFAFEIAKYFQKEGYNYVVSERNDDPRSGLIIDGYTPGDQYVKFSANYGILFNTPSFLQLAQKAFGIRKFQKLLVHYEKGYFFDPYRENVVFSSQEAYLADYEKHIEAVKQSFLQSEVFVVTLGLNECWQLHDGTYMSRNPRVNMYQLVKHKTLTVKENVDNIQEFFDIIKAHNPKFKLIISVSPIPFLATGRANEQHIISANCHSKSVLRVAADELVSKNSDMYYLPSYELVTECIENAWEEDDRHVKPEAVLKVVDMFKEIFYIN